MINILILDGNQRSALAATRSLGKLNLNLLVSDDSTRSLAGESKYACRYLQSPSAKDKPDQFINWFNHTVEHENIQFALPVTEITSQLLLMNRQHISSNVKLPFADLTTITQLADKSQLMKLADSLDVMYPATRYYNNVAELNIANETTFPLVLKPSLSRIYLKDKWLETSVKILNNKDDLQNIVAAGEAFLNYPFMLQEYIPGVGAGVFAIYDNGEEKAFFAHKRLREKPPSGGVSVLSESADLDPQMLSFARKILSYVNWHGVAMVEFRVSDKGQAYLMEVNTRFWGSLQLAIDAGVDFPAILYRISQGETIEPVEDYKKNQQLRWLLGDVDSLYIYLKSTDYSWREKLSRIGKFLLPKLTKRRFEVNRMDDLKPAVFEFKQYIKELL